MENDSSLSLYETLFILRPEQGPKAKEFIAKFTKVVEDRQGTVSYVEEWGNRELAYPIEKHSRGNYSLLRYRAPAGTVEELERTMKLSEGVMRCMTVRLEEEENVPSPHAPKEPGPAPKPVEHTNVSEGDPESSTS